MFETGAKIYTVLTWKCLISVVLYDAIPSNLLQEEKKISYPFTSSSKSKLAYVANVIFLFIMALAVDTLKT